MKFFKEINKKLATRAISAGHLASSLEAIEVLLAGLCTVSEERAKRYCAVLMIGIGLLVTGFLGAMLMVVCLHHIFFFYMVCITYSHQQHQGKIKSVGKYRGVAHSS
jgi:hypothetical protein